MSSIKKSFLWSAVAQFGPKAVQIIVRIVLARLLAPSDFGMMEILV
jgi:O-antigen/teichoic acid export membrane protein